MKNDVVFLLAGRIRVGVGGANSKLVWEDGIWHYLNGLVLGKRKEKPEWSVWSVTSTIILSKVCKGDRNGGFQQRRICKGSKENEKCDAPEGHSSINPSTCGIWEERTCNSSSWNGASSQLYWYLVPIVPRQEICETGFTWGLNGNNFVKKNNL